MEWYGAFAEGIHKQLRNRLRNTGHQPLFARVGLPTDGVPEPVIYNGKVVLRHLFGFLLGARPEELLVPLMERADEAEQEKHHRDIYQDADHVLWMKWKGRLLCECTKDYSPRLWRGA